MSLPLQRALEGKYEILDKIAEGGIGSIYRVRHTLLDEIRVVKVLRPHLAEKEDVQARFVQEAKTAILFRHPNVAQIYDFAAAAGTAYIVMEYIDGVALDDMVAKSGLPSLELALEIGLQGLNALGYLHDSGFIHRDVSPDNLMFTKSLDGSPLVKLIDLGIAKNLAADSQLTATGMFLGKVRYCSPEQFSSGATGLDRRSDIYSYGILLYELLTGRFPIRGESFGELASGHIVRPPYPFEETDPEGRVPQGLRQVVLKALEKKPEKRYQQVGELAEALAAFQRGPVPREEIERVLGDRARRAAESSSRTGSTQERLDRQFRREPTPRPAFPPPAPPAGVAPGEETQPTVDLAQPAQEKPPETAGVEPPPSPPKAPPRAPDAAEAPDGATVLVPIDRLREPSRTIAVQPEDRSAETVETVVPPPPREERTAETDVARLERMASLFVAVRDLLELGDAEGALERLREIRGLDPEHPSLEPLFAEAREIAANGTETA